VAKQLYFVIKEAVRKKINVIYYFVYFVYVLSFSLLSIFKEKESTKEKEINATN